MIEGWNIGTAKCLTDQVDLFNSVCSSFVVFPRKSRDEPQKVVPLKKTLAEKNKMTRRDAIQKATAIIASAVAAGEVATAADQTVRESALGAGRCLVPGCDCDGYENSNSTRPCENAFCKHSYSQHKDI
jgi:hypothetical protein